MDVTGQSGSTTPANGNGRHGEGYPANGWGESWSGAGSALEPEPDSVVPAWRRGMDALSQSRAQTPPRYAEILADAGVRPPQETEDDRIFEPPDAPTDSPDFVPLPQDMFDGLPDDDLLGTAPLGGPFGPLGEPSGALTEDTPPQGTPNPFARLLDIPTVPSAPPAPRASTYPVPPPAAPPAYQPPGRPHSAPPAPPGLRPAAHTDAPVSGSAYAPVAEPAIPPIPQPAHPPVSEPGHPPPSAYGGPPVLTPPPARPGLPGGPGAPAIIRPAPEPVHGAHAPGGMAGGIPTHGGGVPHGGVVWGSQNTEHQDRRVPPASPEPGFEEPELETQVDDVEQPHAHGLPQRVPAEPDVPGLAEQPPVIEPPAPAPVLSRVASGLRRDDLPPEERPDAFDVAAVLSAVRDVPGVKDAQLRATASGGHTLRLDLADGSDPAYVSRVVARMLNERMGLVAEPPGGAPAEPPAPEPPAEPARPAPTVPMQGGGHAPLSAYEPPTGRIPIPPAQRGGPPLPPGLIPASSAPREPRRRHPVTMRGRYPSELRPGLTSNDRTEHEASASPALTPPADTRRVVLDHVQVSTFGLDATVEVRLVLGDRVAMGVSNGPAVDGYILRLSAAAAANAVDELLGEAAEGSGRGHCYVEQASIVPMGSCEVAVVVVLLVCEGWVEQLAGSAVVSGDPRQAVVRATLAAVNRRLTALLP